MGQEVTFVRQEERTSAFGNPMTYHYYRAGSKVAASRWLANQEVKAGLFYLIVETPEGSVGKDIDGFFDPPESGASGGSVDSKKVCTACRTEYSGRLSQCPKCGSDGFGARVTLNAQQARGLLDSLATGGLIVTHGDRGTKLFREGDLRGARTEFAAQLRETPYSAVAHSNLGIVIYQLGDPAELDEAIRLMEAALAMAPSLDGVPDYLKMAKEMRRSQRGDSSRRTETLYRSSKPWWKFW
jgi:hypothetical protein